jgi:hypothetical protein
MANVSYIAGPRFVPAASAASVLGDWAATSPSTALPSAASSRIATWRSYSSATATAVRSGRFTATRQKGSYELWLSVPGHHDSGLDLTIQGG